ncbi:hypothetical protein HRbin16_00699 [bacterium HR16]|nr:hypothetical protein HRbin16_00699 [bacterium HR16]
MRNHLNKTYLALTMLTIIAALVAEAGGGTGWEDRKNRYIREAFHYHPQRMGTKAR